MRLLSLLLVSVISLPTFAGWQLDADKSQLQFISTKKAKIAEVHHFKKLAGAISDSGEVSFDIDLTSVETNIPIRNERMNKFLFETAQYAQASFTTKVDVNVIKGLKAGETLALALTGQLDLHGVNKPISTKVLVVKTANNELYVNNTAPIVINAGDFNLTAGVAKLQELAKLPSISLAVPVSFQLTFKK